MWRPLIRSLDNGLPLPSPPLDPNRSEGSLNKLFMGAARTPQGQRDCFWDWAEFQANSEA